MIYETCVMLRPESSEEVITALKTALTDVTGERGGEVLLTDDWGVRSLPQSTKSKLTKCRYIYFIYKGDNTTNKELERRFRINESCDKFIFVKMGEEKNQEALIKDYRNPFKSAEDEDRRADNKEKRDFAKKRTCWFTANKTKAVWREPSTYLWLLNEFGKISPGRVSGITSKHQTNATSAIKQARNIGLVGQINNRVAR